jgi:FAD/FMN-containing dehydrogenase
MTAKQLPKHAPAGIDIDTRRSALEAFVGSHVGRCEMPLGLARPCKEEQVRALLHWANKYEIPLVPVSSSGGPRRRSDTALSGPAVVVDLSSMQRLIHADGRDAIAVIEPGLTFPAFDAALRPYGLRSFKPLLPRRNKSVLANYLEREPMIAPREHWDTTDPLASLSITFGSGESFRTGGASAPGTLEENLRRGNRQMMASGPMVTDYTRVLLGSQGTLGVVSWASIYCERIPAREEARFYGAEDYASLAEFARLLLLRPIAAHCFVLDRTQAAAALGHGGTAFERVRQGSGEFTACPTWLLYVNITAPRALPDVCMAWQLADLESLAESAGARLLTDATGIGAAALAGRLQELPTEPYKNGPRGAHREVFCLSQLDRVPRLLAAVEPLIQEARARTRDGIVAGLYVQPTVQGVSCHVDFTLFHAPEFAQQACELERRLVERLVEAGGFLSRPYETWGEVAYKRDSNIVPFLHKVKDMFDPKHLLNPGRLCF